MQNSQELVLGGGLVEVGSLLVDKEGVRNPDQLDVVGAHHKLLKTIPLLKGEARVRPELPEVHVQGKVLQSKPW